MHKFNVGIFLAIICVRLSNTLCFFPTSDCSILNCSTCSIYHFFNFFLFDENVEKQNTCAGTLSEKLMNNILLSVGQ